MLKDIKEQLSELLFQDELEEAFKLGQKSGAEFAMRKISFEVKLKKHLNLTKVENRGYERSIEVIERVKDDITTRLDLKPWIRYADAIEAGDE